MSNVQHEMTHGVSGSDTSPDGVVRHFDVVRFEEGGFGVYLRTTSPGQTEPMVTRFGLSRAAFSLLSGLMMEMAHNRQRWAYTPPQADQANVAGSEMEGGKG